MSMLSEQDGNIPDNISVNGTGPPLQDSFETAEEVFWFLMPQVVPLGVLVVVLNLMIVKLFLPTFKK